MNKNHKVLIIRHASYQQGGGSDPELSREGQISALRMAQRITQSLVGPFLIWSSPSKRAKQTADIMAGVIGINLESIVVKEKLWSDNRHPHDFDWLRSEIGKHNQPGTLIIVTHLEYVQQFPEKLGLPTNQSNYAEGVIIDEGTSEIFK